MGESSKPSVMRRWLFGSAWATGVVAAVVLAPTYWLLATASGAQFALERATAMAGGSVGAVTGRLVGPLSIGAIEVRTPRLRIRAEQVALDWSPWRLLGTEVRVTRLHATLLEIATVAPEGPARAPASLAPPLRLFVEGAGVDRLRYGTLGAEKGDVELLEVSVRFAADDAAWIVGGAQALTPAGRARASGTLGARAPFPVNLKGELAGTRNDTPYAVTVEATGPLATVEAKIVAREGGLSGTGVAGLDAFSATPLRRLVARLDGVDLARFAAAPHTRLTVEADLAPAGGGLLAGPVRITNADPGPVDKDRLPIAAAAAQLVIAKDRVEASALTLEFAGGGRARGQAAWEGGRLDATLAVNDADLLAFHSSLRATTLTGDITATATAESQSFRVVLKDPRFEIRGDARFAQGLLTIERARLAHGPSFAEVRGTLALRGEREFTAEGRIERLDPAAFANVPAGQLNATFTARGKLEKGPVGEAVLEIAKSRYAGLPAEGRVILAADGARLSRVDADVAFGDTRVVAKGALGLAGDTLEVKIASPDLAPVGRAFGVVLGGRVDLDARVAGAFAALSGRATFDAKDLALPGGIRVAAVTGRMALGSGDAGEASARVDMRRLTRGVERTVTVERASLDLQGTRRSHEIRVEADFPGKSTLRASLFGGVAPGTRLAEWRGRLESLAMAGRTSLALAAPAALVVSAERIELGEALFAGEPGELRLALTRWTPAGLESRGSSGAIEIRAIRRIMNLQDAAGSNLVLSGDWDVRVGDAVDGFVAIRRVRGDVRVGDPRQALGLEVLSLRAEASGGRVNATADIRGTRVGRWKGEASLVLRRGDEGWEVSPVEPLAGRFSVDVPDLAGMAAWLGPEARAGGSLVGEGTLAGTAREPTWSGRVEATGLAIRDPSLGAEVADGTIAIVLRDREARIERFTLSMPWQPAQEAARAISAAKRPSAGTVTAEGAVDLGTRKGTIRLKASGWPLTRLPTRFLAITGEGRVDLDGTTTVVTGDFTADAGWFGIPASAAPSLSDDVIVDRGAEVPVAARSAQRLRLDLRVGLGEHLHFRGRGLATRLAGSLRLLGDVGVNLRTTGTIRAVGGTYEAYGRTLDIERGALNFQGPVDNPGINVLALRKGLPVEAGVEVLGTVARPRVRLYSSPDVPDPEKLTWLVLGRGQGDVSAGDAATLVAAANALLGRDTPASEKILGRLGLDDVRLGRDDSGLLGTMPQSTVAGRTGGASAAEVVTVGKRLTDDIHVSYRQGLADAEGSLRVAWQFTKGFQIILRAGHLSGVDAVYRFSFH